MNVPDKKTYFDYETFDGYYRMERSYWCETKQRRYWEPVSPDNILAIIGPLIGNIYEDSEGSLRVREIALAKLQKALKEVTG